MKKFLLAIAFLGISSICLASPRGIKYVDDLGPAYSSGASTFTITIASSTVQGARNCFETIFASVLSSAPQTNITLQLLDNGTTNYLVNASTGQPINLFFNETSPWCGTPNTQTKIQITNGLNNTTSAVGVSYKGFTKISNDPNQP